LLLHDELEQHRQATIAPSFIILLVGATMWAVIAVQVRGILAKNRSDAMWTKRLEGGRFHPAFARDGKLTASAIEPADLALIVEGIDLAGARPRPRWEPTRKTHAALNP
jgi:hypothetical protein